MKLKGLIAALLFSGISIVSFNSFAKLTVIQRDTPFLGSAVFLPSDGKSHPGIVMLHGSEGGSVRSLAAQALLLASSGFSVMTFCWYDCGRDFRSGPVPLLAEVELKQTTKAIEWFKQSKYVG